MRDLKLHIDDSFRYQLRTLRNQLIINGQSEQAKDLLVPQEDDDSNSDRKSLRQLDALEKIVDSCNNKSPTLETDRVDDVSREALFNLKKSITAIQI